MHDNTRLKHFASLVFFSILTVSLYGQTRSSQAQKRTWDTPAWTDTIINPYALIPSSVDSGRVLYMKVCSVCHGEKGKGDGIASAGLAVRPADHTSPNVQMQSDGSLYYELSNGHAPMPAYKSVLSAKQRWWLVCYIRSLKPNPSVHTHRKL